MIKTVYKLGLNLYKTRNKEMLTQSSNGIQVESQTGFKYRKYRINLYAMECFYTFYPVGLSLGLTQHTTGKMRINEIILHERCESFARKFLIFFVLFNVALVYFNPRTSRSKSRVKLTLN